MYATPLDQFQARRAARLLYANTWLPAGSTVANTAAETAWNHVHTVPAARPPRAGWLVRVTLGGLLSTAGTAPTIRVKLKAGATVLADTGTVTLIASLSDQAWRAVLEFVVCATGGAGALEFSGAFDFSTSASAGLHVLPAPGRVTFDLAPGAVIRPTVQWGAASASNSITLRSMKVEYEARDADDPGIEAKAAAYYKLGEASGTRPDSAHAYHPTQHGGVGQTAGKVGNCATFDTSGAQYLEHPFTLAPDLTAGAWAGWVYSANWTYQINPHVFDVGDNGNNRVRAYYENGSSFRLNVLGVNAGTTILNLSAGAAFANATWYHLVVNWWNGGAEIWLDGALSASTTGDKRPSLTTGAITLGDYAGHLGGTGAFYGRLDEVGFYAPPTPTEPALTPNDIGYLWAEGAGVGLFV